MSAAVRQPPLDGLLRRRIQRFVVLRYQREGVKTNEVRDVPVPGLLLFEVLHPLLNRAVRAHLDGRQLVQCRLQL